MVTGQYWLKVLCGVVGLNLQGSEIRIILYNINFLQL
jgi:hypothetical protein